MIPKITENTITTYILDGLKKTGIGAEAFVSVETPEGRREVDVYCKNGGTYIVEAKFKESDLWKAAGKIQNDYIKYHKTLGISGGFAILYPDVLAQPMLPVPQEILKRAKTLKFKAIAIYLPEDTRKNFTVFEGTLDCLVEELAKQIIAPPEFIEPNVGFIIDTLRDVASAITSALKHLTGKEIEELFGGEHVFRNILAYEEGKYPVEDLRLASAYLLVNQVLFYHILSKKAAAGSIEKAKSLEELDPRKLTSPSDLKKYFDQVLEINYRAIFSFDVASRIPKKFVSEISTMIGAIQSLGVQKVGGDLLGTIFHDLIPFELRKKVAAFYTDVMAAELLAHLAIDETESKVADLASGSGGLLVAAYKRKKEILACKRTFVEEDHKRFVEEDLLGVDVMPFAANVAACNLALQSPEYFTNKVKVAIWDSTDLEPEKVIPSIAHLQYALTGQQNLIPYVEDKKKHKRIAKLGKEESEDIKLDFFDIVIMNPPFTRQERIPKQYKERLVERFHAYNKYLDGQMSYYSYFILLADKFLKAEGKIALVLPASFLRTRSTEGIRKMLIENYELQYVITRMGQLNFSDATWKREILFIARKKRESEKKAEKTKFVAIPSLPKTSSEAEKQAQEIRRFEEGQESSTGMICSFVDSKSLKNDLDWFRFITSFQGEADAWNAVLSVFRDLESFGSIYDLNSVIKRGIESRSGMKFQPFLVPKDESRAIRKEDVWIASSEDDKGLTVHNKEVPTLKMRIPKSCYEATLRTTAGNSRINLANNTDYVITGNFKDSERFFFGDRKKLLKKLPTFKKYVLERMGNIIIQRRFPIKAKGTIHVCYYSQIPVASVATTWVGNLPDEDAKILCLWFNSSFHLVQLLSQRIEDVWLDVHKYKLQELLVINPKKLDGKVRKGLLKVFDSINLKAFPSLELQYEKESNDRYSLDKAILNAFDIDDKVGEKLLSTVHNSVKKYFESIKSFEAKEDQNAENV